MSFQLINVRDIDSPVKLIADDWALLSAGSPEDWNTMTVSWGGIGEIWGFDAAFVFVRPQRYTMKYLESNEYFTLSFGLPKETTALCGRLSGRDCDKIRQAGLIAYAEGAAVWPVQARLVLVCRKVAAQTLDPAGFLDGDIEKNYPQGDYHKMFVGEIQRVYRQSP